MGFVKSNEEVERIQEQFSETRYQTEAVTVFFDTDKDFVREVLPPCFDLVDTARAFVQIGTSRSPRSEYGGAALNVLCRFGEIEGWYDLAMLMTSDMPVVIGRELWGESKKIAQIGLDASLPSVSATASRNGHELISVKGTFDPSAARSSVTSEISHVFHLKAFLDSSARDLEYDPIVLVRDSVDSFDTFIEGEATLNLQSSASDFWGTVPVKEITEVTYGKFTTRIRPVSQSSVPKSLDYLPYIYGRSFDFIANFEIPKTQDQ